MRSILACGALWAAAFTLAATGAAPAVADGQSGQARAGGGQGHGAAHWGYTGNEGPDHWGRLAKAFATCEKGVRQAPIDIRSAIDADLPPIEFHYQAAGFDEINNGHTIQIDYAPGSFIRLDGVDYELKQFHFHVPSENHIQGHGYPMEGHFVHRSADGRLAVVAVMFDEGPRNDALALAWQDMPARGGTHHELLTRASAAALLPSARDYYRFQGSLTTPPCTEGVEWVVMKQPVTASREQILQFAAVMGHPNNRPLQPLNARVVVE